MAILTAGLQVSPGVLTETNRRKQLVFCLLSELNVVSAERGNAAQIRGTDSSWLAFTAECEWEPSEVSGGRLILESILLLRR